VEVRIPFNVTEADIVCTPLLMTDMNVVNLTLETPDGTRIDPTAASGLGITYSVGAQSRHYRYTLPVPVGVGAREGVWQAVLEVDKDDLKKTLSRIRDKDSAAFQVLATHGARYGVVVQTLSNLRMTSTVEQSSFEPGADLAFRAVLTEYDLPVEWRARVEVELTRPGGSVVTLPMDEVGPGLFEATTAGSFSGVYHARIMAYGATLRGTPFTREQLATAAIWKGGDRPHKPPRDSARDDWLRSLAGLLHELTLSDIMRERLAKKGVDVEAIRDRLEAYGRTASRTAGVGDALRVRSAALRQDDEQRDPAG
jgi:hypothetical protein